MIFQQNYCTFRPYIQKNGFYFTFMWLCIVTNFFLIKPRDTLISQIYFVKKLYIFWTIPLPITFSLYIWHWLYFMQVWWQLSSMTSTVENSWWWAEELPQTCRVSWQNKFGKLERLFVLLKRKKNGYLLKCTKQETPDDSKVQRSFQNCRSSVSNLLHVIFLKPGIWW
jgi:hypothetical protein